MKSEPEPEIAAPDKLKPELHHKIERMTDRQLTVLNRVLLQLEAEELADRLGEVFDRDQKEGKISRIPELVREFRAQNPY